MSQGPRRPARAGCAGLLALATLVAGCASAAPKQPASATTAPPSTAPPSTAPPSTAPASAAAPASSAPVTSGRGCAVIPAGLVGASLGEPTGGPREFNVGQGVTQCVYGTDVSQPAVLRFYPDATAAIFAKLESLARTRPDQHITNLTFEDEAFLVTSTGSITIHELVARRASLIIFVVSTASLQAEETLGHQIFARV